MLVLDTDHVSLLQRPESREGAVLAERLASASDPHVATTIVTFEEQVRGWLAVISKTRRTEQLIVAYARLSGMLESYRHSLVLPFDAEAATQFERLRRLRLRAGSMDLRIAAIALSHGATLLTRNTKDFGAVPGLVHYDWTA